MEVAEGVLWPRREKCRGDISAGPGALRERVSHSGSERVAARDGMHVACLAFRIASSLPPPLVTAPLTRCCSSKPETPVLGSPIAIS